MHKYLRYILIYSYTDIYAYMPSIHTNTYVYRNKRAGGNDAGPRKHVVGTPRAL